MRALCCCLHGHLPRPWALAGEYDNGHYMYLHWHITQYDTWISGSDVNSFCCYGLVYPLDSW